VGWTDKPGTLAHWPGGLVVSFPKSKTVNGTLVMAAGDINLTFKRYLTAPIRMTLTDDYVTELVGEGADAEMMRRYLAAWGDREAYAVSHVGFGMNPRARYEALAMYDQRDSNGTELRAVAAISCSPPAPMNSPAATPRGISTCRSWHHDRARWHGRGARRGVAGRVWVMVSVVLARSACDEAIQSFFAASGLLRGACHRAALCADPLARNDESNYSRSSTGGRASPKCLSNPPAPRGAARERHRRHAGIIEKTRAGAHADAALFHVARNHFGRTITVAVQSAFKIAAGVIQNIATAQSMNSSSPMVA